MAKGIKSEAKSFPLGSYLGLFCLVLVFFCIVFVGKNTKKMEYGPEKIFVVDKESAIFRSFRPAWKEDFCPECFFYYIQDADNGDTNDERKIIIRRKEDGAFFTAKLKNPQLLLKRGERINLMFIQYWRSISVLDEYLVADVYK
jgi:hypothetical protein